MIFTLCNEKKRWEGEEGKGRRRTHECDWHFETVDTVQDGNPGVCSRREYMRCIPHHR